MFIEIIRYQSPMMVSISVTVERALWEEDDNIWFELYTVSHEPFAPKYGTYFYMLIPYPFIILFSITRYMVRVLYPLSDQMHPDYNYCINNVRKIHLYLLCFANKHVFSYRGWNRDILFSFNSTLPTLCDKKSCLNNLVFFMSISILRTNNILKIPKG